MAETINSIVDLKKFFGTPERPVGNQEFKEFWLSCTEQEKTEFKTTPLPKG